MYTVIRRYEDVLDADEVVKRAIEEFGPKVLATEGCQGYWVVKASDGVIASIGVFDSKEAADSSTQAAQGWVAERLAELAPSPPQVTAGETTSAASPSG